MLRSTGGSFGFVVRFVAPWPMVGPVAVAAVAIAAVAALGPARRASRLDPVVALRFE
jgi:ABC-type antimicrobial peptide transport system permease subunit